MKRIIVLMAFVVVLFLSFIPVIIGEYRNNAVDGRYHGLTVVLDAGHGGKDGGASSAAGVVEKDIVLIITQKVADHLRLHGIDVVLTRDGDYDLAAPEAKKRKGQDLSKRVEMMNSPENGVVVSIHANAINNSKWHGAQTFYDPKRLENKQLAIAIMNSMRTHMEGTTREPKSISNIYVLKHTETPATLVEIGFLSNPAEAERLNTPAHQEQIAYSIYEGILYFLDNPDMEVGSE